MKRVTFADLDALLAEEPKVWHLFCRFTDELIARDVEHYSADAILHRIRWETDVYGRRRGVKINNNLSPLFARRYHARHPHRAGFFRLRASHIDQRPDAP